MLLSESSAAPSGLNYNRTDFRVHARLSDVFASLIRNLFQVAPLYDCKTAGLQLVKKMLFVQVKRGEEAFCLDADEVLIPSRGCFSITTEGWRGFIPTVASGRERQGGEKERSKTE